MGCIGLIFSTSILAMWEDWAQPVKQRPAASNSSLASLFVWPLEPTETIIFTSPHKCHRIHTPKISKNYLGTFKKASKGPGRRCNQSSMTLSRLPACNHTPNSSGLRLPVKHLCDLSGQKKSIKSIIAGTLSHQIKTLASTMSTWNWL